MAKNSEKIKSFKKSLKKLLILFLKFLIFMLLPFRIFCLLLSYGYSYALLFLVLIILVAISYKAMRAKILFKMGIRNVKRRKINTLIITLGLMIGTAIISGSLVVGDTLKNMFTKGVYDSYDETDETIYIIGPEGNYAFFDYLYYLKLNEFVKKNLSEVVEDCSPEIIITVSVFDKNTKLSHPSATLIGYNYSESKKFGKFKTIDGKEITGELEKYEIIVNKLLADEMDIEKGDRVVIYYGYNLSIECNVSYILKNEGRARYGWSYMGGGMNIFMPLENVQELLNQKGMINYIKISNFGDKRKGMKLSNEVEKKLKPFLNESKTEKVYLFSLDMKYKKYLESYMNYSNLSKEEKDKVNENMMEMVRQFALRNITADKNFTLLKIGNQSFQITFNETKKSYIIEEESGILKVKAKMSYLFSIDSKYIKYIENYNNIRNLSEDEKKNLTENLTELFGLFAFRNLKVSYNFTLFKIGNNSWEIKFLDIDKSYLIVENKESLKIFTNVEKAFLLSKAKQDSVNEAIKNSKQLCSLFMVMGAFSIIAGMMLIVNIFVLLAEERKSEMGIARAVGMKQKDLMQMFLFEGTAYSLLSAFIGSFGGLAVAYLIISAFGRIFGGFNSLQFFTFTIQSLVTSFCAGFLITIATIYYSSRKVSKLNIIRAIRNIPEPRYKRHEMSKIVRNIPFYKKLIMMARDTFLRQYEIFIILISIFFMFTCFFDIIHPFYHQQWTGYAVGLALFIYGVGLFLRRYILDEKAFTIAGGLVLILWAYPYDIYGQLFGIKMKGGMEMFFFSGIYMVASSVLILMYNSEILLNALIRIFKRFRSLVPVFKTAISYPMNSRFRTGMTIGMFALIIFTITTLAMIMGLISGNIDKIIKEESGGYDMILINNQETPFEDISAEISKNKNISIEDFSKIVPLYTSFSSVYSIDGMQNTSKIENEMNEKLNKTDFLHFQENSTWYSLIGCSNDFFKLSDYKLEDWDKKEYREYKDVWKAVQNNDSLAIVDITVKRVEYGPNIKGLSLGVGDYAVIRDTMSHSKVVKIAGITKQGIVRGIFVKESVVKQEFETNTSFITLIDFKSGISEKKQEEISKKMESEFVENGARTFIIKKELENALEQITNFFYLLEAFLGLGLVVGIAGLGIITIRSVKERQQQIGMLRAIGFKRKMILKSFLIETSFIAILGIIVGVILGIILGVRIWLDEFSDIKFVIPWATIIAVSVISYFFTFICTIGPARGAAKIAPAEALRYTA